MDIEWAPVLGNCRIEGEKLIFEGGVVEYQDRESPKIGNLISDKSFSGGRVSVDVRFEEIDDSTSAEIIIFYDPSSDFMVTAGVGSSRMYSIRSFGGDPGRWYTFESKGDRSNLDSGKVYSIDVKVSGSRVDLFVNGVNVVSTNVNISFKKSQVGVWARSKSEIEFENFKVDSEVSKAFVVMQFSKPYNELYEEVINSVCDDFGIEAVRSDEIYGPGMIIADIVRKIEECKVVIADITPDNPNVYYEIGYSHAINKPTILISEEGRELPFDVSPFRVLFYENTIAGKKKVEEGLREHLSTILDGTT